MTEPVTLGQLWLILQLFGSSSLVFSAEVGHVVSHSNHFDPICLLLFLHMLEIVNFYNKETASGHYCSLSRRFSAACLSSSCSLSACLRQGPKVWCVCGVDEVKVRPPAPFSLSLSTYT